MLISAAMAGGVEGMRIQTRETIVDGGAWVKGGKRLGEGREVKAPAQAAL